MPASDDAIDPSRTRRAVLAGANGLLGTLAGCAVVSRSGSEDETAPESGGDDGEEQVGPTEPVSEPPTLRVAGHGTVLQTIQAAAARWNENPPPEEGGFGGWTPAAYDIETDAALADYYATDHGFEPTGERTNPPFLVVSSSGPTVEAGSDLERGDVDLAATGATPIEPYAPDRLDTASLVEHPIGLSGNVFLVSQAIAEFDVVLSPEEIRAIYAGDLTNWRAVGGPDREIAVVTGPAGTPPRPIERQFFRNVVMEDLDARFGQPQNIYEYVAGRNDAIGDLPVQVSFPTDGPQPVPAVVDGERRTFRDPGYPAMHPLRIFSREAPDDRERAFLDYLQSPFVQERFVEPRDRIIPLDPDE